MAARNTTSEFDTLVIMPSRGLPEKFLVALSFAGEQRNLVRAIAEALEGSLGASTVFFDEWFEHYLAGVDADLKLQEIYETRCVLAVVCVSQRYGGKPWTLAEYEAIRSRAMRARVSADEHDRLGILPIRVGDGDIKGLPFNAIIPEVRGRLPEATAKLIMDRLRLIAGGAATTDEARDAKAPSETEAPYLDSLVNQVRRRIAPAIRERCGTMKILTMSQPIDSGTIYQDVNIFETVASRQRQTGAEDLTRVPRQRTDGIEALSQHRRLLILGKPGAGKSTFVRRVAFLCIKGDYRPDLIPTHLPLKEFTELNGEPDLLTAITLSWGIDGAPVLEQGRSLILLDGLDEVRPEHHDRLLRDVNYLTANFPACPVVITSRIAAREYTFERFTDVELADFTSEQARNFCRQWFLKDKAKARRLIKTLENHERMMELATSPLLVSLMCLIVEEGGDIEGDRAQLYADALDVLLRKWDNSRNISRPYQKLTRNQKEDLLSRIARNRFEKGELFFSQRSLEAEIGEDGEEILNAIEAQHGLLVARATDIYSFSHLTFQEYLTAKSIALDPNPNKWETLWPHLPDPRWREVFQLLAELVSPSYEFLRLAERSLSRSLNSGAVTAYLMWIARKGANAPSEASVASRAAAVRAAYWSLGFSGIDRAPAKHQVRTRVELDLARSGALELDIEADAGLGIDLDLAQALALAYTRDRARRADRARGGRRILRELEGELNADVENRYRDVPRARDRALNSDTAIALERALLRGVGEPLHSELEALLSEARNGKASQTQIRETLVRYRDIGHCWAFNEEEVRALEAYEEGLITLALCLERARNLSAPSRDEILNSVLRPPVNS